MSMCVHRKYFNLLTDHVDMLSWQRRLLELLLTGEPPRALDLPTGLGKTSVMALWLIALAEQMRNGGRPLLPRRLVYVVDRRAVVDQASEEAVRLAEALRRRPELAGMRAALGLGEGESLPVSTLRGRLADNRAWLADPSRPAIIVGTVDMTGSRLLFSGYGVSRGMRPVHAALLAVDSLFVLDESHLVPPFQKLLERIADAGGRIWPERGLARPLRVLPLSATGEEKENAFTLTSGDEADGIVARRLHAPKRLEVRRIGTGGKKDVLIRKLTEAAWDLAFDEEDGPRMAAREEPRAVRVIVFADHRDVAQKVAAALGKRAKGKKRGDPPRAHVELFTGARRVKEREEAAARLGSLGLLAGRRESGDERNRPVFPVATSAGEVGVDLDADHMVGDLVELGRMIQRFGRVNRLGGLADSSIVVLVDGDALKKEKDESRKARLRAAGHALERLGGDASPSALQRLKADEPELVKEASTPPPLHPPLEPAHVEAWAMTSLREGKHAGWRPDIRPWLRGWVKEEPQATLVWRKHLPWPEGMRQPEEAEVEAFFRAAPPHLLEMLEAPAELLARVLVRRAGHLEKMLEKEAAEADDGSRPGAKPALVALAPSGDFSGAWTLERLAAEKASALVPRIADRVLVVSRELGGLEKNGLLDGTAAHEPAALDADWGEEWLESVGYRVRLHRAGNEREDEAEGAGSGDAPRHAAGGWRPVHELVLKNGADDGPLEWLVVEALHRRDGQEGGGPVASCDYGLLPHLQDVEREAGDLAARLGLPTEWREILQIAGRWHDRGKDRVRWQLAAGREGVSPQQRLRGRVEPEAALAKTAGPFRPQLLGGYRHEFGSLLDALQDGELAALPEDRRDIILHLVAAHHGRARPLIPAIDPLHPPTRLGRIAAETALRFTRLQKRFGPWGLAWLEELLRAADRRASAAIGTEQRPCTAGRLREAAHG